MRHAAFLALLLVAAAPATADTVVPADLRVERPMLRETPPNAPVGTGTLTIVNTGAQDDTLLSAAIADDVAEGVDLHRMTMAEGVMRMDAVEGGVPIPAGRAVSRAAGGHHLMIAGLRRPLVAGESHPVPLRFAGAGETRVDVPVLTPGEMRAAERGGAADGGN